MTLADLQLDPPDPADAGDVVRFGLLAEAGRVALWPGRPPEPDIQHPCIAPLVPDVEVEGEPGYAERLPDGVRLVEQELPDEALYRYVAARVLRALEALHQSGVTHGAVGERTVFLSTSGEVVLFGRGRTPGTVSGDVLAAMALLPPGADITMPGLVAHATAQFVEERVEPDARARLAAWVRQSRGRVEEVLPDLGEEPDATGLLDRYEGGGGPPAVDEPGDEDSSTQMNLGATLWKVLAAPLVHPLPPDRFAATRGRRSHALVALLAEERPHPLPTPTAVAIEAFVVGSALAEESDDDSSHTAQGPLTEMAAEVAARAADRRRTPEPSPSPAARQLPPAPPATGLPWASLVLAALGGGAVVGLVMWLLR